MCFGGEEKGGQGSTGQDLAERKRESAQEERKEDRQLHIASSPGTPGSVQSGSPHVNW